METSNDVAINSEIFACLLLPATGNTNLSKNESISSFAQPNWQYTQWAVEECVSDTGTNAQIVYMTLTAVTEMNVVYPSQKTDATLHLPCCSQCLPMYEVQSLSATPPHDHTL